MAHAGGAVGAALLPGRRALAVLHRGLHRALAVLQRALHRALSLGRDLNLALVVVRDWLHRLLRPRGPCQQQRAETPPPSPPPRHGAWIYGRSPRAASPPASAATSPPPPSSPPPRRIFTVDGVVVPEEVVDNYASYCRKASTCPASSTICNFCFFEIQKSHDFRVRKNKMCLHCLECHIDEDGAHGIQCDESGCSVRVRAGSDQALHVHFCHRLPVGWWME